MKRLVILIILALSGCTSLPEDAKARARLLGVYDSASLLREPKTIGTEPIIISSMGYAFPDDALVIEIDRLVTLRQSQKGWYGSSDIITTKGRWRSEIIEDYLILTHLSGDTPLFDKLYISSQGKIGIPASQSTKLDSLEPLMRSIEASLKPKSSSAPLIFIP